MSEPPFDAKSTLRFDIGRGIVTHKSAARQVLLPASSLQRLLTAAPSAERIALGEALGEEVGEALKVALGGQEGVNDAPIEALVTELAGELSLRGFGVASFESWGRALVLRIDNPAIDDEDFLSSLLARALASASSRAVYTFRLSVDPLRILLASESGAKRAQGLLAEGLGFAEVLQRLQQGQA